MANPIEKGVDIVKVKKLLGHEKNRNNSNLPTLERAFVKKRHRQGVKGDLYAVGKEYGIIRRGYEIDKEKPENHQELSGAAKKPQ